MQQPEGAFDAGAAVEQMSEAEVYQLYLNLEQQ